MSHDHTVDIAISSANCAIFDEVHRARDKHPGQDRKTIGEWIILMEDELAEAKRALIKGGVGHDSVMAEICQVAATGVQAMMQHGCTGPDVRAI